VLGIFEIESNKLFPFVWPQIVVLLISDSLVARITGVSHQLLVVGPTLKYIFSLPNSENSEIIKIYRYNNKSNDKLDFITYS
jgi:hypothetical protein